MPEAEGTKSPFGKPSAFMAGCAFGFLSLCGCLAGAAKIGEFTHSGLLGICGLYGDHVGLVGMSFLASFPFSAIAGLWFGKLVFRCIKRNDTENFADQNKPKTEPRERQP
jgi:hypothetical protein